MQTTEARPGADYVSRQTAVLLDELREECQRVLKLLAQLEMPSLQDKQVDDVLGELGAAILHLHEHTRGLEDLLDQKSPHRLPGGAD